MKKGYMLLLLFTLVMLVACQNENTDQEAVSAEENEEKSNESEDNESPEDTSKDEEEKEETETLDPVNTSEESEENEETIQITNLIDSPKEIKHADLDVTITIEQAFFTMSVMPTGDNPKDDLEIIAKDKESYFQVIASIQNDTKDAFSFGNSLGDAKLFLIYDNEHEFDFTAAAESSDGNELGASRAEPLTTTTAHYYSHIPIAVYEADTPLELKILVGEEEYNIPLR